jgi:formate hydrogenlyase subunit 3/multisubunit Na+/H+ antiporter MnhD subunit
LLRDDPQLSTRPARGLMATSRQAAAALSVSLVSLSGLPPSPLFFSELLILLGGLAAGQTAVVIVAAVLLALGFLGLAHALIEGVVTDRPAVPSRAKHPDRPLAYLTGVVGGLLLALSAAVYALLGSDVVTALMGGVT